VVQDTGTFFKSGPDWRIIIIRAHQVFEKTVNLITGAPAKLSRKRRLSGFFMAFSGKVYQSRKVSVT